MGFLVLFVTWSVMIVHQCCIDNVIASEIETKLVNSLFMDEGIYNPAIRPVKNVSDVIRVEVKFTILQLLFVDEKSQLMKTNIWLDMYWNDTEISWNPEEFDGIQSLRVSPDKVWMPEIVLINNADGKFKVTFEPNVVVRNNGLMQWLPPSIYKSSCEIDMTYFPFDKQSCEMKFASWTYNAEEVELAITDVDFTSVYQLSSSWELENVTILTKPEPDYAIAKNISTMTFTLRLKRRPLYYAINLLVPCVLISSLSTWVFYLPANYLTKKITMGVCILLALAFFLTLVYRQTPPTSASIPLITKYLLFTFVMHVIAMMSSVIVLNWNFRTPRTHPMPRWLRYLFLNLLPRILLMTRPTIQQQLQQQQQHHQQKRDNAAHSHSLLRQHSDMSGHSLGGSLAHVGHVTKSHTTSFTVNSSIESDNGQRDTHPTSSPIITSPRGATSCLELHHTSSIVLQQPSVIYNNWLARSTPEVTTADGICSAHQSAGARHRQGGVANHHQSSQHHHCHSHNNQQSASALTFRTTPELHKVIEAIRFIAAHVKNEEDYEEVVDDWHYISLVFDRLHLVVFLIVTVAGMLAFLFIPAYFNYISS